MHAIKYLLQEHNKFRKKFKAIVGKIARQQNPQQMYQNLTKDLTNHEKMEQKVWYPYLKKTTGLTMVIKHLVAEEKKAAQAISKIKKIKNKETWDDKVEQLKTDVEHHANEEETKLFPKVNRMLDNTDLNMIGNKMVKFKRQLNKKNKKK